MANHPIKAEHLTPKATMVVEGTLSFSRLVTPFAGEELAKRVANSASKYPTKDPHFTVSLVDPVVVPQNPAVPSLEEQYIAQQFFTHQTGKNAGHTGFSFDSTSPLAPERFQFMGHSTFAPIDDDRELASGLRVRLLFGVFYSKKNEAIGVGLNAVLVMEQAKFFEPASASAAETLRAMGMTVVDAPTTPVAAAAPVTVPQPMAQPMPQPVAAVPAAAPQPMFQQPVAAPQPMPQPAAVQPMVAPQPVAAPIPAPVAQPATTPAGAIQPDVWGQVPPAIPAAAGSGWD